MGIRLKILLVAFLMVGFLYFLFMGLTGGQDFLKPFIVAIILSMVMSPIAYKLKSWGLNWGLAVIMADLVLVLFIAFMSFLLVAQANQVANNWPQIESRIKPKIESFQNYLNDQLNLSITGEFQEKSSTNQLENQQHEIPQRDVQQQGQRREGQSLEEQQQEGQQAQQPAGEQQEEQQLEEPPVQQQQAQQPAGQRQEGQSLEEQPVGQLRPGQQQEGQQGQQQQAQQPAGQRQEGQPQQQEGQQANQQQVDQVESPTFSGNIRNLVSGIIINVFGFIGDLLLILVYIFFFTYYQKKFEDAVIGLVPDKNKEEAKNIITRSVQSAQQYLLGRLILIAVLAVFYMIGFTAIGLEYAIFISLLAALFALIPYIGNIIGFILAIIASFIAGGGMTQFIIIAGIFSVIQFIENYMLEPYIVGSKVDLNPVAVIVGVVLGGIVWGVTGMILAIPILGIIKVVFDNIVPLQPLGYILDESGISSGEGWMQKIQKWLKTKTKGKK